MEGHLQPFLHLTLDSGDKKEWGKQFCLLKCFVGEKEKYSQPEISARTEMVAVAQKIAEIQLELHILQMQGQQEWKMLNTSEHQILNTARWQSQLPSHHISVFNIHNCFLSDSYSTYSKEASGGMNACKSLNFWKSLLFSNKE